jgi:hypothetical protein
MLRFGLGLSMSILFSLAISSQGWAAGVVHVAGFSKAIQGLVLSSKVFELHTAENMLPNSTKKSPPKLTVVVTGNYLRPGWNLAWYLKANAVIQHPHGEFSVAIPIEYQKTTIFLRAIGPQGQIEQSQMTLIYQGTATPVSRHTFGVQTAVSQIFYSETDFSNFKQTALTFKGSWNYVLVPNRWDFEISSYFTVWPLIKSADQDLRFLGVNLRAGYTTKWLPNPWVLKVLFGYYYITTFVQGDAFGYKNLMGPAIFPSLVRLLNGNRSIYSYFKFSPVQDRFSLSVRMYEVAFGGGYTIPISNGRTLSVGADLAMLNLPFEDGYTISSSSVSVGVSLKW